MFRRYFTEPYRFIPPYRGTFWLRLAKRLLPGHVRRTMNVQRWTFRGQEHLRRSLDQNAGILLAANHTRWADPILLGFLGVSVRQYFYYVVSYHLFKQSRVQGWIINRIGGFSILREGADRDAIRACARILADAERPVVIFPEGTWFRQNDRLGPLQEGLTLIVRQALRDSTRPIHLHPVAIKYWLLSDPRDEVRRRLDHLETRLGWVPQRQRGFLPRLERLGSALLAIKEIEHFGEARTGSVDDRITALADAKVTAYEKQHLGRTHPGHILERVRRLRQRLVRRLAETRADAAENQRTHEALDDLLFCENLSAHSMQYLTDRPSLERLTETVARLEETIDDTMERPIAPMGATVTVGPPLDARAADLSRAAGDAVVAGLGADLQGLLDAELAQGPPAEWNCPASVTVV